MITTIEEAQYELQVSIEEAIADNPDTNPDDIAHDMVSCVCWNMDDKALALEFCRIELGLVPFELEEWLGKRNFLEGVL